MECTRFRGVQPEPQIEAALYAVECKNTHGRETSGDHRHESWRASRLDRQASLPDAGGTHSGAGPPHGPEQDHHTAACTRAGFPHVFVSHAGLNLCMLSGHGTAITCSRTIFRCGASSTGGRGGGSTLMPAARDSCGTDEPNDLAADRSPALLCRRGLAGRGNDRLLG